MEDSAEKIKARSWKFEAGRRPELLKNSLKVKRSQATAVVADTHKSSHLTPFGRHATALKLRRKRKACYLRYKAPKAMTEGGTKKRIFLLRHTSMGLYVSVMEQTLNRKLETRNTKLKTP
jgi:hypothetical protein